MRSLARPLVMLVALAAGGCATTFTGDAHFPGGPRGCRSKCAKAGLEMGAFVYAGEYSSACVCRPPGLAQTDGAAPTFAAATGVVTQMRQAAQQQQQQHHVAAH